MSQSFPRFNTKCSRENELLCGIFWVVFRLPLHFVLYCTYLRKYWGCGRANYVSVEGTVRISKRTRQMSSELFDTFHSTIVCGGPNIRSWIRIQILNKSFRIHNTGIKSQWWIFKQIFFWSYVPFLCHYGQCCSCFLNGVLWERNTEKKKKN